MARNSTREDMARHHTFKRNSTREDMARQSFDTHLEHLVVGTRVLNGDLVGVELLHGVDDLAEFGVTKVGDDVHRRRRHRGGQAEGVHRPAEVLLASGHLHVYVYSSS